MPQTSGARPVVLYVEDDADIAQMTVEMLGESYEVAHAADVESARTRALQERFDVMVIDRRLPGGDGIDLVQSIRQARITTPILLLTALGGVDDRIGGLDAGANDYLVKPFDYGELLARLRALVRGYRAETDRRQLGDWTFIPSSQALYSPFGGRVALTNTESALLELLSASPEHVFSREEILRAVFHEGDGPGSVDTYVHYLRRKTVPEMVETVRARGYRVGAPA
ncbi:response regulator transcription factor [Microbacterium sediminicola]|uniref:Response regulator transcription factor n=1 Tax=Microbacterium sediminicola TaxID=415210 RepID=A0ABN2HX53_9MICO